MMIMMMMMMIMMMMMMTTILTVTLPIVLRHYLLIGRFPDGNFTAIFTVPAHKVTIIQ